jgi:cytochrome d ubiquinol oxidase subunit I
MEGLAAFFLVHVPRAVAVRLGQAAPRIHLLTIWAVSFGSALSAAFIMAANSWMQHPVSYTMVRETAAERHLGGVHQPVFVWEYAKVLFASLVTGAAVMLAVSVAAAAGGKRAIHPVGPARARRLVPAILFTMLVGDSSA